MPKLDAAGVAVGHLAHLGTPFGPVGEYSLLSHNGGTYLNRDACLPSDWHLLAERYGRYLSLPVASLSEAFEMMVIGDLSCTRIDLKADECGGS